MTPTQFIKTSAMSCLTLWVCQVALAGAINVPNFSFENPVTAAADTSIDVWTDLGGNGDGVFASPGFGQDAAPTDGNQIAFMNADSGQIFQTLTDTYLGATNYTLTVDVSARAGPGTDQMSMVLYTGTIAGLGDLNAGNTVGQQILDGNSGVVADEFNTFTLNVAAADIPPSAIGQQIGIGFFGLNAGDGTSDFDLDNVTLTAIAVPESNAIVMWLTLALLLCATVMIRKFRRVEA